MKRQHKREVDRFTSLPNYLLEHEAVRSLSPAAFKVMVYLAKRCFGPKNNGQIAFGARFGCKVRNIGINRDEEKTIGPSPAVTARALLELQKRGLVQCTKGSTFKLSKRSVREYALAWVNVGEESRTNDFLYWHPAEKQKGPLASDTIRRSTVSPTRQPPRQSEQNQPLQSHPRHYGRPNSIVSDTRLNQCNRGVPNGLSVLLDSVRIETEAILKPENKFGPRANALRTPETIQ